MTDPALGGFINRERQRLVGYVRSLLRDAGDFDAEDLVHDVLLNILERADPTVPLENLAAYVYRSLRNRVVDHARTRRPTVSLNDEPGSEGSRLADALADVSPDALDALQSERGRVTLFQALQHLSDMERKVVIAHEFEGIPFREMARCWDVPRNTLLSHKRRGVGKLKQYLLQTQGGES